METLIKTPEMGSDKREDFLYKTHSQVLRLQELLEDISTISRLEEPELKEPMESVDFYALALDLADEIVEARLNEGKKLLYTVVVLVVLEVILQHYIIPEICYCYY